MQDDARYIRRSCGKPQKRFKGLSNTYVYIYVCVYVNI